MPTSPDPIFDLGQFTLAIGPLLIDRLGGDGTIQLIGTRSGTVNRVVTFTYGGRRLGARLALDRRHFRYERDIIKEVFAISLLSHAGESIDDNRAGQIVAALLAKPQGSQLGHDLVRSILYYDWSMRLFPFPFFIFEWIPGTVLWENPTAPRYHAAGSLLADLHRVRFEHFYEDIFSIHHVPRSWRDHLRVCLNRELARAELFLPGPLVARLHRLDMSTLSPGVPCLVHNDFSGANIVFDEQDHPHVIDWDNWVVDCPELDLVKMKYWTAIGGEGHLVTNAPLYDAFLAGYRAQADHQIDETRLCAYEHLWLLRCFNFENARLADDEAPAPDSWRPVYPGAEFYVDRLDRF